LLYLPFYSCGPTGRGGCLKNSPCVDSNPTRSTKCCCSPTGRGAGLRNQRLWVSPSETLTRTTPTSSTKYRGVAQLGIELPLWKRKVAGSNPAIPTIYPCDAIGRHCLFSASILQVSPTETLREQILPGVLMLYPQHEQKYWAVGRADMRPPFKRNDPGSTPGRPSGFLGIFSRWVVSSVGRAVAS
jgi:hypothetical protein